jgi:hypothetical protein
MKKRLIFLAAFLFLASCTESDYTSPLSSTTVKEETTRQSRTSFSWTQGRTGSTLYSSGTSRSSYFTGGGVPFSGTSITNVSWDYNNLPSGITDSVILHYTRPYSAYIEKSVNISDSLEGSTDVFNEESAKGQISMEFFTSGGVYPMIRTLRDTVTVIYDD